MENGGTLPIWGSYEKYPFVKDLISGGYTLTPIGDLKHIVISSVEVYIPGSDTWMGFNSKDASNFAQLVSVLVDHGNRKAQITYQDHSEEMLKVTDRIARGSLDVLLAELKGVKVVVSLPTGKASKPFSLTPAKAAELHKAANAPKTWDSELCQWVHSKDPFNGK